MKKVLIEIPEKELEHLQSKDKFEKLDIDKRSWLVNKVCNLVKDGKVLSDLTNGEIVNTLFDIDKDVEEVWGEDGYMHFIVRTDIWDAPYKAENEE